MLNVGVDKDGLAFIAPSPASSSATAGGIRAAAHAARTAPGGAVAGCRADFRRHQPAADLHTAGALGFPRTAKSARTTIRCAEFVHQVEFNLRDRNHHQLRQPFHRVDHERRIAAIPG